MPYGDGAMWGMHWTGWLFGIIVIATVLFLIVRAASPSDGASRPSAREILDRKYASGEISSTEYEERKAKLLDNR